VSTTDSSGRPQNGLGASERQLADDGDRVADRKQAVLATLREHARGLADELRGSLRRVRVRAGEFSIEIEWQAAADSGACPPAAGAALIAEQRAPADPSDARGHSAEAERVFITSPMVGTFYRAPEPGAAPFVAVGSVVERGEVVGIVEAMKLMNPIASEVAGAVAEITVADGQAVEFGEPLVALIPSSPGTPGSETGVMTPRAAATTGR
jgi:acetyl-CoA carboxylase biotin carboxyl carrier protein